MSRPPCGGWRRWSRAKRPRETYLQSSPKRRRGSCETEAVGLLRFERDGAATLVAQSHSALGHHLHSAPVSRWVARVSSSRVLEGPPTRVDDWSNTSGAVAGVAQAGCSLGVGQSDRRRRAAWGAMTATRAEPSRCRRRPTRRSAQFSDLAATAIANAAARTEVERLARRTGRAAAGGDPGRRGHGRRASCSPPSPRRSASCWMGTLRDDPLTTTTARSAQSPPGHRRRALRRCRSSGRPRRAIRRHVAGAGRPTGSDNWGGRPGPIGGIHPASSGSSSSAARSRWRDAGGALAVHSQSDQPPPASTESRLVSFTELVAHRHGQRRGARGGGAAGGGAGGAAASGDAGRRRSQAGRRLRRRRR